MRKTEKETNEKKDSVTIIGLPWKVAMCIFFGGVILGIITTVNFYF